MAYSDGVDIPYLSSSGPKRSNPLSHRPSMPNHEAPLKEGDVVQGRIFWLPPKEELPDRAVRRAHGKGVVDEGIYNHPVVVLSSPVDDGDSIHFHLITSFQGKRLHEVYGKANEFHTSRRSWYLPVSPTPDHPDANSKKAKKRFPTLDLYGGAHLRWDSYVNLRHVYKIQWSCLRQYTNQETPSPVVYRFERESMIRLLSKSRFLTGYEAGEQRHPSSPKICRKPMISKIGRDEQSSRALSPDSDVPSRGSDDSVRSPLVGVRFLGAARSPDRTAQQHSREGQPGDENTRTGDESHERSMGPPSRATSDSSNILMRIIRLIAKAAQGVAGRLRALFRIRKRVES